MLPYWILFAIFAVGAVANERAHRQRHGIALMFLVAMLFVVLIVGLRYRVGGDWGSYEELFARIRIISVAKALSLNDPGYALLNWVTAKLGMGLWFVNLVAATIFAYGLAQFTKTQPNPWLAVLVAVPYLIIVVAMGYTRQGVAIGFVLAALSIERRGSWLRFGILVFLAAAFHKSAILVIPLVGLTESRNRLLSAVLLVATGLIIYYLFVAGATDRLVRNYIDTKYSSSGALIRVLMNLPPSLIFLFYARQFELDDYDRRLWKNFALGSLVALVLLVTTPSSTAVDRMALYLIPLQMLVLGRLPYAMSDSRSRQIALASVILYSAAIQFVWLNYAVFAFAWVPYHLYPIGL